MVRLRSMLASLLVTKQIVGNLTEMALPMVQSWMAEVRQEKVPHPTPRPSGHQSQDDTSSADDLSIE